MPQSSTTPESRSRTPPPPDSWGAPGDEDLLNNPSSDPEGARKLRAAHVSDAKEVVGAAQRGEVKEAEARLVDVPFDPGYALELAKKVQESGGKDGTPTPVSDGIVGLPRFASSLDLALRQPDGVFLPFFSDDSRPDEKPVLPHDSSGSFPPNSFSQKQKSAERQSGRGDMRDGGTVFPQAPFPPVLPQMPYPPTGGEMPPFSPSVSASGTPQFSPPDFGALPTQGIPGSGAETAGRALRREAGAPEQSRPATQRAPGPQAENPGGIDIGEMLNKAGWAATVATYGFAAVMTYLLFGFGWVAWKAGSAGVNFARGRGGRGPHFSPNFAAGTGYQWNPGETGSQWNPNDVPWPDPPDVPFPSSVPPDEGFSPSPVPPPHYTRSDQTDPSWDWRWEPTPSSPISEQDRPGPAPDGGTQEDQRFGSIPPPPEEDKGSFVPYVEAFEARVAYVASLFDQLDPDTPEDEVEKAREEILRICRQIDTMIEQADGLSSSHKNALFSTADPMDRAAERFVWRMKRADDSRSEEESGDGDDPDASSEEQTEETHEGPAPSPSGQSGPPQSGGDADDSTPPDNGPALNSPPSYTSLVKKLNTLASSISDGGATEQQKQEYRTLREQLEKDAEDYIAASNPNLAESITKTLSEFDTDTNLQRALEESAPDVSERSQVASDGSEDADERNREEEERKKPRVNGVSGEERRDTPGARQERTRPVPVDDPPAQEEQKPPPSAPPTVSDRLPPAADLPA